MGGNKPIKLSPFEFRLCLIIREARGWTTPTAICSILSRNYMEGLSSKKYEFSYICGKMRILKDCGLLDKVRDGKESKYKCTQLGKDMLESMIKLK